VITDQLTELVDEALEAAVRDGVMPDSPNEIAFERPRRREHGDWATNVALHSAARGNPRSLAEAIVARLPKSDLVDRVDVAGPGFLNFHLSHQWLQEVVRRAAEETSDFGRSAAETGRRVNVEYVSANPTGPINVVTGRHAAVGDAIANLLEAAGHDVVREYYINDSGRQVRLFVESVAARYLQQLGVDAAIPEDGYKGDYVTGLAQSLVEKVGGGYRDASPQVVADELFDVVVAGMVDQIRASLERFGTSFDVWFSERSLREGRVDEAIRELRAKGVTEERDGALWLLSSRYGDDKDRVLVRSNGEPTYTAADAAYLMNKFERGFDNLIYLWGADHHGTVARLLAIGQALGYQRAAIEVLLMQIVTLSGAKGSKRAGVYVALDELIDEVGKDAARYTFLTRSIDVPLDFDLELAKEQAPENPVYYVQYAHARICSILRKAAGEEARPGDSLDLLRHPSEDALMRKLAAFEELVPEAAAARAPQRVTRYVEELASDFSAFYRDCRVVSEDVGRTGARLTLCLATKRVIADALGLLGVGAPESM
jgi:arginyl-tRNA synthetase